MGNLRRAFDRICVLLGKTGLHEKPRFPLEICRAHYHQADGSARLKSATATSWIGANCAVILAAAICAGPASAQVTYEWWRQIVGYGAISPINAQIAAPVSVAVNPSNHQIVVGVRVGGLDNPTPSVYVLDANGSLVRTFGSAGTGNGQFSLPTSIAIDVSSGNIIICDRGSLSPHCQIFTATGVFIRKFGGAGNGNGQLNTPRQVVVDPGNRNIWVADAGNHRVQIFSANGDYLSQFGTQGSAAGQFDQPAGIAVDQQTRQFFVADRLQPRIQVFDSSGNYIREFSGLVPGAQPAGDYEAVGAAIDPNNRRILIINRGLNVIRMFGLDGVYQGTFGTPQNSDAISGSYITKIALPYGIAIDPSYSAVFVTNLSFNNLLVFASCDVLVVGVVPLYQCSDPGDYYTDPHHSSRMMAAHFDTDAQLLGPLKRLDFEQSPLGLLSGGPIGLDSPLPLGSNSGVTLTLSGAWDPATGITETQGDHRSGYNTTEQGSRFAKFVVPSGTNSGSARFDFLSPIQAFGAMFTGVDSEAEVNVTYSDGTTQSLIVPESDQGGTQFWGITDRGRSISSITIIVATIGSEDREIIGVDDIRFVDASSPPSGCAITPASGTHFALGATAQLSVNCASGGTVTGWQWTMGGVDIPGATSMTYAAQLNVVGSFNYSVKVSSGGPFITVGPNQIIVDPAQPSGCAITPATGTHFALGATAQLSVNCASGGAVTGSQWVVGGVDIPGATSTTYAAPTNVAGSFNYSVKVSSGGPFITVGPNQIIVDPAQPSGCAITPATGTHFALEATAQLSVNCASGGSVTGWQWTMGGVDIPGATSMTYAAPTNVAGSFNYSVRVSSGGPFIPVGPNQIIVDPLPPATCGITPSTNLRVTVGNSISLSVACTSGGVVTSWQWMVGGADIAGATFATYLPPTIAIGTFTYSVRVSSGGPPVTIAGVDVQVVPPAPTARNDDGGVVDPNPLSPPPGFVTNFVSVPVLANDTPGLKAANIHFLGETTAGRLSNSAGDWAVAGNGVTFTPRPGVSVTGDTAFDVTYFVFDDYGSQSNLARISVTVRATCSVDFLGGIVNQFADVASDRFFMTADPQEAFAVRAGYMGDTWYPTGRDFFAYRSEFDALFDGARGVLPVCRFYGTEGAVLNAHFYTADPAECEKVKNSAGWRYEGIAFYIAPAAEGQCRAGTEPVYRMLDGSLVRGHRYTTDLPQTKALEDSGWITEGTVFCAPVPMMNNNKCAVAN